jgi:hypothetical protein
VYEGLHCIGIEGNVINAVKKDQSILYKYIKVLAVVHRHSFSVWNA